MLQLQPPPELVRVAIVECLGCSDSIEYLDIVDDENNKPDKWPLVYKCECGNLEVTIEAEDIIYATAKSIDAISTSEFENDDAVENRIRVPQLETNEVALHQLRLAGQVDTVITETTKAHAKQPKQTERHILGIDEI